MLSEFRARLAEADAGRVVFDAVLRAAGEAGLVKAGKRQRTDATHALAATRDLSRLEFVVKTLRAALNQIAGAAGDWLAMVAAPEWFDLYSAGWRTAVSVSAGGGTRMLGHGAGSRPWWRS